MDGISHQLQNEIQSLETYIERLESRFLASTWLSQLLDTFEALETNLNPDELQSVLKILYHTKEKFHINDHLSARIDQLLSRYAEVKEELASTPAPAPIPGDLSSNIFLSPENDPADSAADSARGLFEEEDEEISLEDSFAADDIASKPNSLGTPQDHDIDVNDILFEPLEFSQSADENLASNNLPLAEALFSPVGQSGDAPPQRDAASDLFTDEDTDLPSPGTAPSASQLDDALEIFETENPDLPSAEIGPSLPTAKPPSKRRQKSDRIDTRQPSAQRGKKRPKSLGSKPAISVNPIGEKISPENLQAELDIAIPRADLAQLDRHLHDQINGRTLHALQADERAAGKYILIPRITRFAYNGEQYNCSVKNLAKTYYELFGDIQKDLMPYRDSSFMNNELPELGWALVTAEAPQESLGKNWMEQQQYLRQLATKVGLPSHLVRRRTLVETLYDLIVGRLVLKQRFLTETLDWTSTGPTKNDFICVCQLTDGIRLRDLTRTSHLRALGLCPTW